jgi:hypothetical protein
MSRIYGINAKKSNTPNANLTIEQLPQFKEFMEKNFERLIAGVEWVTRGFKEIN